MKKFVGFCLLCVIFILSLNNRLITFASSSEQIEFAYNNRIFCYSLAPNIKSSNIFDVNYEINKYNRFGSTEERKELLKKLVSLGFSKKIAIEYIFPNISNTINIICKNINQQPEDAKLNINEKSKKVFHIIPEIVGKFVDIEALYEAIYTNYVNSSNMYIKIPIINIQPQLIAKALSKQTNLMADFETDISTSSPARKHNIKTALKSLNKLIIKPNEVFSFNKVVGRRTEQNGYREAKIIVNNEFVEGIGGGVCQVSSTLYNSALLAGLEILEANKHSKQVGYVKYGFDAMVNYGSSDLKFRNNTNQNLTIITNLSNTKLRIRIFGENLNTTSYVLSNEILNVVEPIEEIQFDNTLEYADKVTYEDEYFVLTKASKGMEIKSYREKYINGVLKNKELLRHDKFKVQNSIKVYGIKKRTDSVRDFYYSFWLAG